MTASIPTSGEQLTVFDCLEADESVVLDMIRRITPGTEFSVNVLRDRLDAAGFPQADRPGAFRTACKEGLCAPVRVSRADGGQMVKKEPSTGASARGAYVTVYRRLEPGEGA